MLFPCAAEEILRISVSSSDGSGIISNIITLRRSLYTNPIKVSFMPRSFSARIGATSRRFLQGMVVADLHVSVALSCPGALVSP